MSETHKRGVGIIQLRMRIAAAGLRLPCRRVGSAPERPTTATMQNLAGPRPRAAAVLLVLCLAVAGVDPIHGGVGVAAPRSSPASQLPPELHAIEKRSAYGMVASGIPEASWAGALMLEQGGNAVDAAVAAAFALGVVDPFNAGLGGQCYALIHLRDGRDIAIDGSAPLPLRIDPHQIRRLNARGALDGYRLATTPATPAALAYALQRYGTMSLAQVLAPAIELADCGHPLMPTIEAVVDAYYEYIRQDPFFAGVFLKDGLVPFPPGHIYFQPVLAETFRRLAAHGVEDFYRGAIADEIGADMAANGGYVSKTDLAHLRVTERAPVRGLYRDFEVVAFPYPGAGDMLVEALQILEAFPPELLQGETVDRLHLLVEAMRIAFSDAIGSTETSFLSTLSPDTTRGERRASLIRFDRALREEELPALDGPHITENETTQVSVMDRFGNAVALTQSLGYGSLVATPSLGFQYNSLLESCEFCDRKSPSFPVPLATLRSTMTPTILLCHGTPYLVLGSPGSSRIVAILVAVITNVVDRGMTLRDAIVAPRVLSNRPNPTSDDKECYSSRVDLQSPEQVFLEIAGPITTEQANELQARGFTAQYRLTFPSHDLNLVRLFGGVNAVMVDPATGLFVGVGDPRRHGGVAAPGVP